jgi:hypothetical protein
MQRKRLAWIAAFTVIATLIIGMRINEAEAGQLKAQVFLIQVEIPKKITEQGLIGFARRNNTKRLRETQDQALKDRQWKANMIVSFNSPPDDLEYQVLFYDVHDGPRRLVEDMSSFVNDRKQKTYLQKIALKRPRFKPNRNMELVVVVKHQEVSRLAFGVVGQEAQRSGSIDFSDEEAKLK